MNKRIIQGILMILVIHMPLSLNAVKIRAIMDCKIYLQSGSVRLSNDSVMVAIPESKQPLYLMSYPYTARQAIKESIEADQIDSVVMWNKTSPLRTHTLTFMSQYGWCWMLERGESIKVYCFAPKGYHINGIGGMYAIGKSSIIVVKDGKSYKFDKTGKMTNDKFRRVLAEIVADDPVLVQLILRSSYRRDKTLRMLSLYSPLK